jgi:hypothetical protein
MRARPAGLTPRFGNGAEVCIKKTAPTSVAVSSSHPACAVLGGSRCQHGAPVSFGWVESGGSGRGPTTAALGWGAPDVSRSSGGGPLPESTQARVIVAECRCVLFEPQPAQPRHYVHAVILGLAERQSLTRC